MNATMTSRANQWKFAVAGAILSSMTCVQTGYSGVFTSITIDGSFTDWAGVPAFATDGDDNTAGNVDFNTLYLANDEDFLYVRYTLHDAANPHTFATDHFFDTDANIATGFNVSGGSFIGSEILLQGAGAFQEASGTFNDGALTTAGFIQSPFNVAGTDFEFRLSRATLGVAGAFNGVALFSGNSVSVHFLTSTGTGDSIGNGLTYTFGEAAAAPEPSSLALLLVGGTLMSLRRRKQLVA